MSREIKFRFYGSYGENGEDEMLYGDKWAFEEYLPINDIFNRVVNGEDTEVMQYTGLKDKNGVEIYEGDILQYIPQFDDDYSQETYEVIWETHGLEVRWLQHADGPTVSINGLEGSDEDMEVIGNIYENPELLGSRVGDE